MPLAVVVAVILFPGRGGRVKNPLWEKKAAETTRQVRRGSNTQGGHGYTAFSAPLAHAIPAVLTHFSDLI